jgi:hypothetical protein
MPFQPTADAVSADCRQAVSLMLWQQTQNAASVFWVSAFFSLCRGFFQEIGKKQDERFVQSSYFALLCDMNRYIIRTAT